MRITSRLLVIMMVLGLFSCSNHSKLFPGFSVTNTGIHYMLISLGDGVAPARSTDYVTINITYRTVKDSVFFQAFRQFQLTEPRYEGSIDECFLMLSQGDSAAFYIKAQSFFTQTLETELPKFINPDDFMRVDVKMLEIKTPEAFQQEMEAFMSWIEDFGDYEKVIIKQYLDGQKLSIEPTESGLYIVPQIQTARTAVEMGDTVTIHYEGRFFNGKIFDSTRKRNEPFQFVYGQKWQVIPGIEEAIGKMREGEKSMLIVPSHLAFGEQGNSSGIIPAFTSVVFELEVTEVKKGVKE
ncbi:MAG: FKBP-type peptidyl-prolyl cis-trans isomerase [Bacteroidales bacterium]